MSLKNDIDFEDPAFEAFDSLRGESSDRVMTDDKDFELRVFGGAFDARFPLPDFVAEFICSKTCMAEASCSSFCSLLMMALKKYITLYK